jgi:TP901 family phage tail tape measure protein
MPIDSGGGGKYLETLWIGIKADYTSLQAGLKMSQNQIQSFVGHIATSSAQLKKFGTTTTMVSAAVAAMGVMVNQVFAKFEQSMANTLSVLGGTEKEMEQLDATARKMGETTIFSASQAADAMYYLASAGYNVNQVMGALKGTLDLAAATQYDLAETTRIVVSSLNAYGLEASEAGRVSNLYSAIISASQATMERLGDSMKYVAPIAAQLGISIEQTSAALGLMYNAGLEASQAGTYLRAGLIRLQSPTKGAMQAIKELGLSYDDINPQMHNLVEIMDAFEKAGAGMIDKGDELSEIFDTRAVGGWQILINSGAEALTKLEEKITGTNKSAEMAATQINTFSGSMKLLKSVMQEAAIQIGKTLQPILRGLVDWLKDAFALFNIMPKGIKTVTVTIIALAAGLGLIVGPVAILLAQLPTLIAMFSTLGVSMSVALGWVGAISIAIIALTAAIGGYVRSQTELNTAVKQVTDQTKKEQIEFDLLARRYLELKGIVNKTTTEKELYLKTIKDLIEKYPNYFKNMDLEKIKFEDAKIAIDGASASLREYLNLKIAQSILEEENAKYIETGKKMANIQEQLTDATLKLKDAQKQWNDETADTVDLGNDIKLMLPTLEGFWNELSGNGAGKIVGEAGVQVENLTSKLKALEAEQNAIYENIKKKQENVQKQMGITTSPVTAKENGTVIDTECPDGYHWDTGKKMCVPDDNKKKVSDEEKSRVNQLEQEIISIKKRSLQAQLDLLAENKDKSLEQAGLYLSAKHILEKEELKNWYELEKKKLVDLKANNEQMKMLDKSYIDEVDKLEKKQIEESKNETKKWDDNKKGILENRLNYEADHYSDGLVNLKKYLGERLATLVSEGKKWNDEYLNILNQMDAVDKEMDRPKENKMKYDLDNTKRKDIRSGGTGYSKEYGIQLEAYQKFLLDKLTAYEVFSTEYTTIMNDLNTTQEEMYRNQLEQARFLFFSIQNAADIATASIGGAFDQMWNQYIMPKSRAAKNELDAIWMALKGSFISVIGDMVKEWISKAVQQLIFSQTMQAAQTTAAIATGAAMAAAYAPAAMLASVMSFGGAAAAGAAALSAAMVTAQGLAQLPNIGVPGAATGAVVKKSGTIKVHPDEVIVPANIVRANKKQYQNAAGQGNGMNGSRNINNNVSLVLNNPVVDDNRYWDTVFEEHINPAIDRIKKRMS